MAIGDARAAAFHDAGEHFPAILHAAAAVHDQVDARKVAWKIVSLAMGEAQVPADILPQPARDLHAADIVADRVVGAGFENHHGIPRLQVLDRERSTHEFDQVALVAGEQD